NLALMIPLPDLLSTTTPTSLPSASSTGSENNVCKYGCIPDSSTNSSSSIFNSCELNVLISCDRYIFLSSGFCPDSTTAPLFFKRSRTSSVKPAIICLVKSVLDNECQVFTIALVATPPNAFCFSITATDAPNLAARTAAKTPVQLPPKTQISTLLITGKCLFLSI